MALMTIYEANIGGEAAREKNAARERMDALVAQVAAEYDVRAGCQSFIFEDKRTGERVAHTSGEITEAEELDIAAFWINPYCPLPAEAFVEYSRRRVYANFCRRMKTEARERQSAVPFDVRAAFDSEEIIAETPELSQENAEAELDAALSRCAGPSCGASRYGDI